MLTNILLIAIILILGLALACSLAVFNRLKQIITDFITPVEPDKPSQLANVTEVVAGMFGRAITAQIKTTLMGMESGASRALKAVEGDIALDRTSQSPLAGLLGSFPTLRKSIRRNPQLLDVALGVISDMASRKAGSGSNGSGERTKFQL